MRRISLLLACALALGCRGRSGGTAGKAGAAKKAPCAGRADALARMGRPSWYDPTVQAGAWPPSLQADAACRFDETDLDGDGHPELTLACPTGHFEHGVEVYRVRGDGCFVDVGGWVGKDWEEQETRHHGWADVEAESAPSHSGGKRMFTVWRYEFDGKRYRLVKTEQDVEDEPEPER
jgi:hypothetical protein